MCDHETFSIEYNGRDIEIPKSSAKFQNGYAAIKTTIKDMAKEGWFWYEYDLQLMGVIDEDFDTVLNIKGSYADIQVFPEGNIIAKVRFTGGDGEQSYTRYENHHYKINGKTSTKVAVLKAWEYDRINETTIKVRNNVFESGFESLYDVVQGRFISEKFTTIGKFEQQSEDSNEKLAKAVVRLPYNDEAKNVCDVVCYIDESGAIRTSIYNPHSDHIIETTSDDFDFSQTIETIRAQMAEDTTKKATIANKLIKTTSIPKQN